MKKSKLIIILMVLLMLMSCGNEVNSSVDSTNDTVNLSNETSNATTTGSGDDAVSSTDEDTGSSDVLKARAKEEGVSVKEMESMIMDLATMTAEKYQTTYEAYISDLEKQGKTAFDEFATAADFMGITIKEYYEYEKSKPAMSQEDSETLVAMNNAMSEISNMASDGAKTLEEDYEALKIFNVDEVLFNSKIGNTLLIQYVSDTSYEEVITYYKDLLEDTDNAMFVDAGDSVTIMGSLEGNMVNVTISKDYVSGRTNVDYTYTGDIPEIFTSEEVDLEDETMFSVEGMAFEEWALFQMDDMNDTLDLPEEGHEYVEFVTSSLYKSVVEYYIELLKETNGYTEYTDDSDLVLYGTINDEAVEVRLARDADITYVRVDRFYEAEYDETSSSETSNTDTSNKYLEWVLVDVNEILLEDPWSDGSLSIMFYSNSEFGDLASFYKNEFMKYDEFTQYGSVEGTDVDYTAVDEGVSITISVYYDSDNGLCQVVFTNGPTK